MYVSNSNKLQMDDNHKIKKQINQPVICMRFVIQK